MEQGSLVVVALDGQNLATCRISSNRVLIPMWEVGDVELVAGELLYCAGLQQGVRRATAKQAALGHRQVLTHQDHPAIPLGMALGLDSPEYVGIHVVRGSQKGLVVFPEGGDNGRTVVLYDGHDMNESD
jgi:hypothetical protein